MSLLDECLAEAKKERGDFLGDEIERTIGIQRRSLEEIRAEHVAQHQAFVKWVAVLKRSCATKAAVRDAFRAQGWPV